MIVRICRTRTVEEEERKKDARRKSFINMEENVNES